MKPLIFICLVLLLAVGCEQATEPAKQQPVPETPITPAKFSYDYVPPANSWTKRGINFTSSVGSFSFDLVLPPLGGGLITGEVVENQVSHDIRAASIATVSYNLATSNLPSTARVSIVIHYGLGFRTIGDRDMTFAMSDIVQIPSGIFAQSPIRFAFRFHFVYPIPPWNKVTSIAVTNIHLKASN